MNGMGRRITNVEANGKKALEQASEQSEARMISIMRGGEFVEFLQTKLEEWVTQLATETAEARLVIV